LREDAIQTERDRERKRKKLRDEAIQTERDRERKR
jgi:hypothetical protein